MKPLIVLSLVMLWILADLFFPQAPFSHKFGFSIFTTVILFGILEQTNYKKRDKAHDN